MEGVLRPLKTYQLVTDIVGAALFFAFFAIMVPYGTGGYLVGVLLTLGMSAALAVRRLSPALALGLAWAAAILQMLFGLAPMPSDVAVFGVLYVTAAYGSRAVFWAGFVSSFVGAVAIAVYIVYLMPLLQGYVVSIGDIRDLPSAILILIAAVFALLLAWTAGALVRTAARARANRAAQQRAESETVAEQERVRIARDMHDVVAHSLAVVIAQADGARYAAAADPAVATTALGTISTTARAALTDVRMLLTQLRHSQGDGPQPELADLDALYDQVRAAGVDLRVDVHPVPANDVPASVQLAVFRIVQEALTNALRHGGEGAVSVRLAWYADRVDLEVRSPLRPGSAQAEPSTNPLGHGIIGMRERAQLVGGTFEAGPQGDRFVVSAALPMGVPA